MKSSLLIWVMMITKEIFKRFYEKISVSENNCWNWNACKDKDGYGWFVLFKRKMWYAHRASYLIHNGFLPNDLLVRHNCDNPSCVNPNHLELGTDSQNKKDSVIRKRHKESKKTHCKNGHEFSMDNLRINSRGNRVCKICDRLSKKKSYHRIKNEIQTV